LKLVDEHRTRTGDAEETDGETDEDGDGAGESTPIG
jgi:hypothetical protein